MTLFRRAFFLSLLAASLLAADDIVLLDGKRISGTVVGFENGSFRVETDFGVALVRKDKIARIEVGPQSGSASQSVAVPAPPARPGRAAVRSLAIQERRPPGGRIQEHVEGTTYVNDSFGFAIFKPPTWKILENTTRNIPSAVAALGTADEATLFLVGSVLFDGSPQAYATVLDSSLRRLYSEYEPGPEEQAVVAGRPTIRRQFRGVAGGRDWHGVVVNLADGSAHYGIIGVTSEEIYGFKESVIGKMLASLRFRP